MSNLVPKVLFYPVEAVLDKILEPVFVVRMGFSYHKCELENGATDQ